MREICSGRDTVDTFTQSVTPNPAVTVYDTSGPYTDPAVEIDVREGLPRLREDWVAGRGDVQQLEHVSSVYGRRRQEDTALDGLRFSHIRPPMKAKPGLAVTQLAYARRGIITPEMEYIAIRENQRIEEYAARAGGNGHGMSTGSLISSACGAKLWGVDAEGTGYAGVCAGRGCGGKGGYPGQYQPSRSRSR